MVLERVRIVEETAAAERRRTGATVLGRKNVLAQKWIERPGTWEPRRQLSPRVAARSKWSRIEALLRSRAFRDTYAAARGRLTQALSFGSGGLLDDRGANVRPVQATVRRLLG